MKTEASIQLLKFCFQLLNCILLVLGVSVLSCSLWILFSSGNLLNILPSDEVGVVGLGLLLIGALVLLVSAIGCVGAHSEKVLLLMVYLGLLVVLVLGQLFVALLLVINRDKIGRSLDETVEELIRRYSPEPSGANRLLDGLQKHGRCCGRMGPSDWLTNSFLQNLSNPGVLPCSCFNSSHSAPSLWCSSNLSIPELLIGREDGLYEQVQGCETSIGDWLQQNVVTIAGMAFALILVQVIQGIITAYLWHVIGQRAALTGSSSQEDSDHAPLDPTPEEELEDGLNNHSYIHPQPADHHDNKSS